MDKPYHPFQMISNKEKWQLIAISQACAHWQLYNFWMQHKSAISERVRRVMEAKLHQLSYG